MRRIKHSLQYIYLTYTQRAVAVAQLLLFYYYYKSRKQCSAGQKDAN